MMDEAMHFRQIEINPTPPSFLCSTKFKLSKWHTNPNDDLQEIKFIFFLKKKVNIIITNISSISQINDISSLSSTQVFIGLVNRVPREGVGQGGTVFLDMAALVSQSLRLVYLDLSLLSLVKYNYIIDSL